MITPSIIQTPEVPLLWHKQLVTCVVAVVLKNQSFYFFESNMSTMTFVQNYNTLKQKYLPYWLAPASQKWLGTKTTGTKIKYQLCQGMSEFREQISLYLLDNNIDDVFLVYLGVT